MYIILFWFECFWMVNDKLQIVLVDENDREIWLWEKMEVHKKWLLHRAISVLILNRNWKMLLQQRALGKYHCGWMWSNAVCTHPYHGESNIYAAHRRLCEEMWFDTDLKEIFQFSYIANFDNWLMENEFDHVFLWYYDADIKINVDEVSDYRRMWIGELKNDMVKHPDKYTQWFKIMFEEYLFLKN